MTICLTHFPIGMGGYLVIFVSNRKMTLETEKGETSRNILTIYSIQSDHCVNGLLMIDTLWALSRITDFLRNAAPTYTQNYGCQGPSKEV